MRRSAIATSVAAALVLAAPAGAKEPLRATICGASGCTTVTDPQTLREIPAGENTTAVGPAAPYYRLQIVAGERNGRERHSFSLYYVPSANAMAWAEEGVVRFHPIYGDRAPAVMRKLTARLQPFPRPRVSSVIVGNRRVSGVAAQTYLRLFSQQRESRPAESPSDWVRVDLRSARGSPWTDGKPDLMYSPSTNLLERGWLRIEVPAAFAADIEAGRRLDESSRRGSTSWAVGVAILALGAVGGVAGLWRTRVRR
jgi:hypothetical protein